MTSYSPKRQIPLRTHGLTPQESIHEFLTSEDGRKLAESRQLTVHSDPLMNIPIKNKAGKLLAEMFATYAGLIVKHQYREQSGEALRVRAFTNKLAEKFNLTPEHVHSKAIY